MSVVPGASEVDLGRFIAQRPGASGSAHQTGPGEVIVATAPSRLGRAGELLGDFGELSGLVRDAAVTDIFVNSGELWVDRGFGAVQLAALQLDETGLRELAVRLVALGGRHIDEAAPCVDVRLHDGIRVHAVLPPISSSGTLLTIRLPGVTRLGVTQLEAAGFFSQVPLAVVRGLVSSRENLLITGAGGSGKTTLLGALLAEADPADRIIAIEDVAELRPAHPHFVSLEARQANLEGAGAVGLERLVREALRMRPDRLVLGECRGAEIRELLAALNTGHDGGAGTLHANSLADVPARIEALGALAGMSPTAIARQTVSAIGTVLHLQRTSDGRKLVQLGHFELDDRDRLRMVEAAVGGALTPNG
ncbi:MAG: type II/type pathway secretion protein [Microbacteriaceae bacterium]|nr:type II/type pathway secretion protein [Microbacteriaceae bacterium]